MSCLSAADLGDCRYYLPGHSEAIAVVVPGDVVRGQPEEWGQCLGVATTVGVW